MESRFTGWYKFSHRALQALRHFGIHSGAAMAAAQEKDRWNERLRAKGWAPRQAEIRDGGGGRSGRATGRDEPGRPAPSAGAWPQPEHVMRCVRAVGGENRACDQCGYETPFPTWLTAHRKRFHPDKEETLAERRRRWNARWKAKERKQGREEQGRTEPPKKRRTAPGPAPAPPSKASAAPAPERLKNAPGAAAGGGGGPAAPDLTAEAEVSSLVPRKEGVG
jgi:hypothetical protein